MYLGNSSPLELYNNASAPWEDPNVVKEPEYVEVIEQMDKILRAR